MTQVLNFRAPLTLRAHAADVLRRARRLPVGAARNDLRQLAIGLRCLDLRQAPQDQAVGIPQIPTREAPLAPL